MHPWQISLCRRVEALQLLPHDNPLRTDVVREGLGCHLGDHVQHSLPPISKDLVVVLRADEERGPEVLEWDDRAPYWLS